jgi:hypothetical protein
VAEFRIPFSQLRFPSGAADRVWGLHCWRWHREENAGSHWHLIPRDNSGVVYQFGELRGLETLRPGRQWRSCRLFPTGQLTNPANRGTLSATESRPSTDVGLDAKVGISSNFILDLTVLPDFGQVEADPSELNLSTVETFLQEQRPFFLEGKNLLSSM